MPQTIGIVALMNVPEAIREAARDNPGVPLAVPDVSQAFEHHGRMVIPHTAVIGYYIVDEYGEVVSYEINLGYRMRVSVGENE